MKNKENKIELNEAAHPGMSAPVRKKLATSLLKDRKMTQAIKDPKEKEYMKNLSKFNATTYNPEVTRQTQNKTTPIAKKNTEAFEKNTNEPKGENMYKKNFIRMNENSTFKSRLIQENAYGMPGGDSMMNRMANDGKKNWKKYALGAGTGALGMAASHIMGDSDGGAGDLDTYKEAHEKGELGDTIINKIQGGMENLKSNNNMADFASKNSTSVANNTGQPTWSPGIDKLKTLTGESVPSTTITPESTPEVKGPPMTIGQEAKAEALQYSGNDKGNFDNVQSGWPWNKQASASMTDNDIQNAIGQKVSDNYDNRWDSYQDKMTGVNDALKEFNAGDGEMSISKLQELKKAMGDIPTAPTMNAGSITAANYGVEDNLQKKLNSDLQGSIQAAKNAGLHFLGDSNVADDVAYFAKLKAGGGIPEPLMPLYRDVMRKASQGY